MTRDAGRLVTRVEASYEYDPACLGMFGARSVRALSGTNVYVAHGYTYTGMEYVQQQRTRVEIDLNVRVRGNDTFVGFDDVSGPVAVGESVEVYESESGVAGEGRVTEIDSERELVYLSVDWASLKAEDASSSEESSANAGGQGWPFISGDSWSVGSGDGWALSAREASAATTQLMFVGAVTSAVTAPQEPWMELVPRPYLAGIGGVSGTIRVTAPLYSSASLNNLVGSSADRWLMNVSFGNAAGAAA